MAEPRVFRMPSLGADMTEGRLLEWLVHPGDAVHRGDLVAVVKTDKADVEVEIFDDGVIGELLVPDGDDMLEVGTPLATVVDAGAAAPPPRRRRAARRRAAAASRRRHRRPPPPPAAAVAPPPGRAVAAAPRRRRGRAASRRRRTRAGAPPSSASTSRRVAAAQPGHPITAADVDRAAAVAIGAPRRDPTAPAAAPVDQADGDAPGHRPADGALQARDPALLPARGHRAHARARVARAAQRAGAASRRASCPAALLYKAVALAAAAHAGAQRLLDRRPLRTRLRRAPRRRDLAARRRPRRAGRPRRRPAVAHRAHGRACAISPRAPAAAGCAAPR